MKRNSTIGTSPPCVPPEQGLEIRELKASKADKAALKPHIDALLSLKAEYKEKAGKDYAPGPAAAQPAKAKEAPAPSGGGVAAKEESPAVAEISAKIVAKVCTAVLVAGRRFFRLPYKCVCVCVCYLLILRTATCRWVRSVLSFVVLFSVVSRVVDCWAAVAWYFSL